MPIYEYDCSKCGHIEVFQSITDDPLTRCPTCKRKVTKLISQSSFQLKGTGWYVTDYAGKGAATSEKAKEAAKDTSDSGGSAGTSSESGTKGKKKAESKSSGSGSKAA